MKTSELIERSPATAADALRQIRPVIQQHSFLDSVLTDAVLIELKNQSTAGCLLCSFEELDREDWD